ncbi:MAG: SDR family NAD(P)-dependent oxidoreductase [Bdellovibrionales bacterium]
MSKALLITGTTRGMGREFARDAARRSYYIHLLNRSEDDNFENELMSLGAAGVRYWICDLSQPKDVGAFLDKFQKEVSSLDVIFNNAGMLEAGSYSEISFEKEKQLFELNYHTPIQIIKSLLPLILSSPKPLIINNASVLSKLPLPFTAAYNSSKAALVSYTNSLRMELYGKARVVQLITPGVATELFYKVETEYNRKMKFSFFPVISGEKWSNHVWRSIDKGEKREINSSFFTQVGIWLYFFFPKLMEWTFSHKKAGLQ